jgi:hypothetical protein
VATSVAGRGSEKSGKTRRNKGGEIETVEGKRRIGGGEMTFGLATWAGGSTMVRGVGYLLGWNNKATCA